MIGPPHGDIRVWKRYSEKITNLVGEVKISDLITLVDLTFLITVMYDNITESFEEKHIVGIGFEKITLSIGD
jgi:hypothetical protein